MSNLILRINNSSTDSSYASAPSNFISVADDDSFIISDGSDSVKNNAAIPTDEQLNLAAPLISATLPVIVGKYFLADVSAGLLKEIYLAGNQNKQYVFCCSFDGATSSEPVLEAWDNDDMDTYTSVCLGTGTPNQSWYKAVCTTTSTPGADWTGTPLAGNGSSNIVQLNNGSGALSGASDLYFNFKVIIPAALSTEGLETPVLCITFTSN